MAAPALRAVRGLRLQALLLPRINVTPVRGNNGGEGSSHTGIGKTLVSFPVKFSNFQDSTSGENVDQPASGPETPKPLHAPPPAAGSVRVQSEGGAQLGDEVSQQEIAGVDKDQEEGSSSSSSDSDSESEEEEDQTPQHGKKRDGDGTSLQALHHKQSHTHGERTTTQEHKEIMVQKQQRSGSDRSEDLVDPAPPVATEEPLTVVGAQSLGGGQRSGDDENLPGGPSYTDDIQSDASQILSSGICAEPTQGIDQEPAVSGSDRSEDLVDPAPPLATEEPLTVVGAQSLGGGQRSGDENLPGGPSYTDDIQSDASQILSSGICAEPTQGIDQEPAVSGSDRSEDLVDTAPPIATEEPLTVVGAQSLLGGGQRSGDENLPGGPSSTDDTQSDASQILSSGICEEPTQGIDLDPADSLSPPGPPAAPAPEEPCDNSKYQNEQHFSYTPFTFVDYDVELAKFRLPQPSSGRPSPRH